MPRLPAPALAKRRTAASIQLAATPADSRCFPLRMPLIRLTLPLILVLALAGPAFAHNKKPVAGVPLPWKQVPGAVQMTIQAAANGGKVKETRKLTVNSGIVYCAEVKGTDGQWSKVYATESGALLKVEPDKARNKRKHKPLFD